MTRSRLAIGALALVAIALAGLARVSRSAEAAPTLVRSTSSTSAAAAVLVELFTSEGCSSCPPADALVASLAESQPVQNAHIIVLAHHVDYWNQLGWPDPFSSAESTARQRAYASGAGMYTPQVVVDGRADVSNRRGSVEQAIVDAAKRAHVKVQLTVTPSADGKGSDVMADVGPRGEAAADLVIAVVQDRASVAVSKGENAGKTLDHVAIARSVRALGPVEKGGGAMSTRLVLPAAAAAGATTFSVVAFVQERSTRRVVGTARAELAR